MTPEKKLNNKPYWNTVSTKIFEEINKSWRARGYRELTEGQWRGLIRGHDVWWLSEVFMDCYSKEKGFDSYKCWKIVKEHQIKREKKLKQGKLI